VAYAVAISATPVVHSRTVNSKIDGRMAPPKRLLSGKLTSCSRANHRFLHENVQTRSRAAEASHLAPRRLRTDSADRV
jgi:hypothetical protein